MEPYIKGAIFRMWIEFLFDKDQMTVCERSHLHGQTTQNFLDLSTSSQLYVVSIPAPLY